VVGAAWSNFHCCPSWLSSIAALVVQAWEGAYGRFLVADVTCHEVAHQWCVGASWALRLWFRMTDAATPGGVIEMCWVGGS
jgi:hypothetical protein